MKNKYFFILIIITKLFSEALYCLLFSALLCSCDFVFGEHCFWRAVVIGGSLLFHEDYSLLFDSVLCYVFPKFKEAYEATEKDEDEE